MTRSVQPRGWRLGGSLTASPVASLVAAALATAVLAACGSGSVTTLLSRGLAAQKAGDLATASADYLHVVSRQPRNKLAWYNLGVIASHNGDTAGATHDYNEVIAADPNYVPALYNLAIVLTRSDPTKALGLYQRVLTLQPDNAEAHLNEGLLLESTGKMAAGEAQVARAVALNHSL